MEGRFGLYIVCVFMYLTFNVVIILHCNVFAEKVEGRLDLYYSICMYMSVAVRQVGFPDIVRTV